MTAGPGLYRQRFTDMSLQGYVLASPEHVYFPGGRSGPWVFTRVSGERKGQFGGGGGTYAVVSEDDSLIYGPGKTSPTLAEFLGDTRDSLAAFPGGRHIVVIRDSSYVATSAELICMDRARYLQLALISLRSRLNATSTSAAQRSTTRSHGRSPRPRTSARPATGGGCPRTARTA